MQAQANELKEKLEKAVSASKYEASMKERAQLRMKVLEEVLKASPSFRDVNWRHVAGSSRGAATPVSPPTISPTGGSENGDRPGSARLDDFGEAAENSSSNGNGAGTGAGAGDHHDPEGAGAGMGDDVVSGVVHDALQRELVRLSKLVHDKDHSLHDKDSCIEALTKKLELLEKLKQSEVKKARREIGGINKELAALKDSGNPSPSSGGSPGSSSPGIRRALSPTPRMASLSSSTPQASVYK
eukprot:jgi/Mesen1/4508/ME000023S03886